MAQSAMLCCLIPACLSCAAIAAAMRRKRVLRWLTPIVFAIPGVIAGFLVGIQEITVGVFAYRWPTERDELLEQTGWFVCWAGACLVLCRGLDLCVGRGRRSRGEPRCRRCGYCLIGIVEPRCPECGNPFDPRNIASAQ